MNNRRDFFKKTAIGAAATVVGSTAIVNSVGAAKELGDRKVQFSLTDTDSNILTRKNLTAENSPDKFGTTVRELWTVLGMDYYTATVFLSHLCGDDLVLAAGYHSSNYYNIIEETILDPLKLCYGERQLKMMAPSFLHDVTLDPSPFIHVYHKNQRLKTEEGWEL